MVQPGSLRTGRADEVPPIDSRKLIYKLETAQPYVSKIITFEFSHFMSPNSMWPSARMLYRRYREFVASTGTQGPAGNETKSECKDLDPGSSLGPG